MQEVREDALFEIALGTLLGAVGLGRAALHWRQLLRAPRVGLGQAQGAAFSLECILFCLLLFIFFLFLCLFVFYGLDSGN